jgi:hypothetical protein
VGISASDAPLLDVLLLLLQVVLSASPRTRLSSGGPAPFLPGPISTWPTEGQCKGHGLLAAAFREDRVPAAVSKLTTPSFRFLRRRNPSGRDEDLLRLLVNDCEPLNANNHTAAGLEDENIGQNQDMIPNLLNSTFYMPYDTTQALIEVNRSKPSAKDAERITEGHKQLLGWPKQGTQFAPAPPDQALNASSSLALCRRQLEELRTSNITLPGLDGNQIRTECGRALRSKIVVYVHNCFTEEDTDIIVRVDLVVIDDREDVCESTLLWSVQAMCLGAMTMMAVVAGVCIIPELLVTAWRTGFTMYQRRKRAQASKDRCAWFCCCAQRSLT